MFHREIAHLVEHEWITDSEHDVCLRPFTFNNDGVQTVEPAPDPAEFKPLEVAENNLRKLVEVRLKH